MKSINIQKKFASFTAQWHPHQIATVDDMHVLLAKLKDEFVWHAHEAEDELFLVQKGVLEMHFEDRVEIVQPGELIVVPKGVSHCPKTKNGEEVWVLLFEKQHTKHTGSVQHEKTQTEYPKI
ncbi:cupin domain-containing protein [Altibacter sp. HG106]|uniref:cupin domain-containing protein n=1 Tax=Altibacter sp. HG106 TaxID=3023937 RepID=UPI00235048D7|nr:cupin domain-containing protein [Altibacter sp. HG106]MDC7994789.1 cupin domain-containing protein [Altibacter sp. HG106]